MNPIGEKILRLKSIFEPPTTTEVRPPTPKEITRTNVEAIKLALFKTLDEPHPSRPPRQVSSLAVNIEPIREAGLDHLSGQSFGQLRHASGTSLLAEFFDRKDDHGREASPRSNTEKEISNNHEEVAGKDSIEVPSQKSKGSSSEKRDNAAKVVKRLTDGTHTINDLLTTHEWWTDTPMLLNLIGQESKSKNEEKLILIKFLYFLKNKTAEKKINGELASSVPNKIKATVPKGSLQGTKHANNCIEQVVKEALDSQFDDDLAKRVLSGYRLNSNSIIKVLQKRIKEIEIIQKRLMESVTYLNNKFEHSLGQEQQDIINYMTTSGIHAANKELSALAKLALYKKEKKIRKEKENPLPSIEPRVPSPSMFTSYEDIRKLVYGKKDYKLELKMLAQDLCFDSICLFKAIKSKDFVKAVWGQNIANMSNSTNKIALFVTLEILKPEKDKHRIRATKFFIRLCTQAMKLNDMHTAVAIAVALNNRPISALKNTWKALNRKDKWVKYLEKINEISELALLPNSKFKEKIETLRADHRYCVPHLPPILNAFLRGHEQNPDYKTGNDEKELNNAKIEAISSMQQYINTCQALLSSPITKPATDITDCIRQLPEKYSDEEWDKLYDLALVREPRKR